MGQEVFTVKTENGKNKMIPAGLGARVTYNSLARSYIIMWRQKEGNKVRLQFRPIGKIEDLQLFQEDMGKQYALDTSHLYTEGVLFDLLVNLKNKTISDEGLLITGLKRK